MNEETCGRCGDLLNDKDECYSCSPSTIDLHKDFIFEFAFEELTLKDTLFKRNYPDY